MRQKVIAGRVRDRNSEHSTSGQRHSTTHDRHVPDYKASLFIFFERNFPHTAPYLIIGRCYSHCALNLYSLYRRVLSGIIVVIVNFGGTRPQYTRVAQCSQSAGTWRRVNACMSVFFRDSAEWSQSGDGEWWCVAVTVIQYVRDTYDFWNRRSVERRHIDTCARHRTYRKRSGCHNAWRCFTLKWPLIVRRTKSKLYYIMNLDPARVKQTVCQSTGVGWTDICGSSIRCSTVVVLVVNLSGNGARRHTRTQCDTISNSTMCL